MEGNVMRSRGILWRPQEVVKLVQEWKTERIQAMTLVGKPNKEIFTIISNSLNKLGIERSPDCCLKKLQALKREFRKYKDKVNSSGEAGDLYPPASIADVYEDLNETIGKDPLTIPSLITSDNLDDSFASTSSSSSEVKTRRKRKLDASSESIQTMIENAEDRQDKRFKQWMQFQAEENEKERKHDVEMLRSLLGIESRAESYSISRQENEEEASTPAVHVVIESE